MKIIKTIQQELLDYENNSVEISEGVHRSAHKRIKRISFFKNRGGEDGKIDDLGQYQYWLNPIKVYVDSTVKNLRIDTKNIMYFSTAPVDDFAAIYLLNNRLKTYLWENGKDDQLKEDVEYFVGWGNCLWKNTGDNYELCDLSNTYIINQKAKTVNDSPIIERYELTQSDLRNKKDVWDNIEDVIKNNKNKTRKSNRNTTAENTTNPIYEIYERTGEVSEEELYEAQGKKGGDANKYVLAKIIVSGIDTNSDKNSNVLFAEELKGKKITDYYKEAHFGNYDGTWLREGLYEMFFDYVVAIREIDNAIQEGLDWASKVIFKASDNKTFQNVRTDIENGRIINSENLSQVDVRLQNLDQLIARRNNLVEEMDKVAHSFEIVQGQNMPSNTPFALANRLDENAGKYFVQIKQKITGAYKKIYKEWELKRIIKDISKEDIIKITGNDIILDEFRKMLVNSWYNQNLVKIGVHDNQTKEMIKAQKLEEIKQQDHLVKNSKEIWQGIEKRTFVTITGENTDLAENLSTIATLLQLEQDPTRRAYLLDRVYAIKNIPIPPTTPQPTNQTEQVNQISDAEVNKVKQMA